MTYLSRPPPNREQDDIVERRVERYQMVEDGCLVMNMRTEKLTVSLPSALMDERTIT